MIQDYNQIYPHIIYTKRASALKLIFIALMRIELNLIKGALNIYFSACMRFINLR
jgi:hypothetical protein